MSLGCLSQMENQLASLSLNQGAGQSPGTTAMLLGQDNMPFSPFPSVLLSHSEKLALSSVQSTGSNPTSSKLLVSQIRKSSYQAASKSSISHPKSFNCHCHAFIRLYTSI